MSRRRQLELLRVEGSPGSSEPVLLRTFECDDEVSSRRSLRTVARPRARKRSPDTSNGASAVKLLKEMFLPDGWPHSVSTDYVPYQVCALSGPTVFVG